MTAAWLLIRRRHAWHRVHCGPGGHGAKQNLRLVVERNEPHIDCGGPATERKCLDVALSALPAAKFS